MAAVVKVALRSRETLALIRPVGDVLRMHTMLWPDELRDSDFAAPEDDVKVSEAEVFARGGIKDVLVSNQVRDPAKIDRLARIPKLGARAICCVGSNRYA